MGTRGLFGFRLKEKDYLMYNHFDSYPSFLGKKIANFIKFHQEANDWDNVRKKVEKIILVDKNKIPSVKILKEIMKEKSVISDSEDWYSILRNNQGDLESCLTTGYMTDDHDFITDSLFCEWVYIVNLDTMKLEIYKGYQKKPHNKGRYANLKGKKDVYYPCALIGEFDFDNFPNMESIEEEKNVNRN